MSSALLHFDNDEIGANIRAIADGETHWFVAKEVCVHLALTNVSLAVNGNAQSGDLGLDDDEKGIRIVDTLGGKQKLLCVTESGLYALIFKSRKPEAKAFRKWVTSEVLPALRRGAQPQALTAEMMALLSPKVRRAALQEQVETLERQIAQLRAQADLALVVPGQMSVYQWLLLQGEKPRGGECGRLSGICARLAAERGLESGEVKVIEHMGQRVRLCRTARTYPEEILREVCGEAAA